MLRIGDRVRVRRIEDIDPDTLVRKDSYYSECCLGIDREVLEELHERGFVEVVNIYDDKIFPHIYLEGTNYYFEEGMLEPEWEYMEELLPVIDEFEFSAVCFT